MVNGWDISCETALIRMSLDHTSGKSGNSLVPSGNKPLPEPMLTQISVTIWRHYRPQWVNPYKYVIYARNNLVMNDLGNGLTGRQATNAVDYWYVATHCNTIQDNNVKCRSHIELAKDVKIVFMCTLVWWPYAGLMIRDINEQCGGWGCFYINMPFLPV